MDRVFASGAAATPPSPPSSPSTGYPSKGNPSSGTAPTKPGDYWYYMITESLRKVITDSGLTPDHTNVNLVSLAIQNMIAAGGFKTPTRAATTANITTLAGGAPNTLDGVSLAVNDRVLVKDQTTAAQNGLYIVTTLGTGANGTWTRSTDADGAGELFAGMLVVVNEGTTNADSIWELSTDGAITIGTTAIVFTRKDTPLAQLPRGHIGGLTTQLNGVSPTIKIDIAPGSCRSDDDTANIVIASTITKQISAAWASGNNGGLDTGAVAANTGYHVWAIYNPTTGTSDVLFSLSATAPTMPSGYTKKRWLWYLRTDGSSLIRAYFQRGDTCLYKTPALDVNGVSLAGGATALYTLPVPDGQIVRALINVLTIGGDAGCYVHDPATDQQFPNLTTGSPIPPSLGATTASNPDYWGGHIAAHTNTASQIRVDGPVTYGQTLYIGTLGWACDRGRNN